MKGKNLSYLNEFCECIFYFRRCIFLYVNDSADDFPLYFPSPVQKNAFAELLKNVMEKMEVSGSNMAE